MNDSDCKHENTMIIRQEKEEDFSRVRDVVKRAFENVKESDHTEHLLVERLRKSEAYIPDLSLVAEMKGEKIVGHILLSKVEVVSEKGFVTVLGVAPLSVLPEFQGQGIGGMLIREAHKRASGLGYGAALLLGHKDYYPRFGYRKASEFGIKFPVDVPDEYTMAVELRAGGLKGVQGQVRYPDAFHEL